MNDRIKTNRRIAYSFAFTASIAIVWFLWGANHGPSLLIADRVYQPKAVMQNPKRPDARQENGALVDANTVGVKEVEGALARYYATKDIDRAPKSEWSRAEIIEFLSDRNSFQDTQAYSELVSHLANHPMTLESFIDLLPELTDHQRRNISGVLLAANFHSRFEWVEPALIRRIESGENVDLWYDTWSRTGAALDSSMWFLSREIKSAQLTESQTIAAFKTIAKMEHQNYNGSQLYLNRKLSALLK